MNVLWDIVIVTHNNEADLVANWQGAELDNVRIWVVDNSSTDASAKVALTFADHVVVAPNKGLSVGNNIGARLGSAQRLLFCNPDIRLAMSDLRDLAEHLDLAGGVVAPRLVNPDGSLQPNGRSWPTLRTQMLRRLAPTSQAVQAYLWPGQHAQRTDWVTGACVGIQRRDYDLVGGWPEEYFLYFEDVAFCRRARDRNFNVEVCESIQVVHSWARSSHSFASLSSRRHAASAYRYHVSRMKRKSGK